MVVAGFAVSVLTALIRYVSQSVITSLAACSLVATRMTSPKIIDGKDFMEQLVEEER